MASFEMAPNFKRALKKKTSEMRVAIMECIDRLEDNPDHPSLHRKKMQGQPGVWEARIDRANRLTFHYSDDGTLVLRNHCNHDILKRSP